MGERSFSRILPWSLPPTAKLILMVLAIHHDEASGRCDPGIARLVAESGLSERAVYTALRTLKQRGAITVRSHPGRRCVYDLAAALPGEALVPDASTAHVTGRMAQVAGDDAWRDRRVDEEV